MLYYDEDFLEHIGVGWDDNPPGRGSGRYPHGSGEEAYRHNPFMHQYLSFKKDGYSDDDIQKALGFRTKSEFQNVLRAEKQGDKKNMIVAAMKEYEANGGNASEVGRKFGVNESTVRSWKAQYDRGLSQTKTEATADILKKTIDQYEKDDKDNGGTGLAILDISDGTELSASLNCTQTRLNTAVGLLTQTGEYKVSKIRIPRTQNPKDHLTFNVLTRSDVDFNTIKDNIDKIRAVGAGYVDADGAACIKHLPVSISSKNVMIRYRDDDDGHGHKGIERDGCIEIRPGARNLNLNGNVFAQVRIAVDDTHYLKGMAVYGDPKEFPPGVDVIFNTNKHRGTPMCGPKDNTVLKPLKKDPATGKIDPDNPFGATIKINGGQFNYTDEKGRKHQSPINIVNDDEDWEKWSKSLPSQFLSKQTEALAKQQLGLALESKKNEYDQIMAIKSPQIRKYLLSEFADGCDKAAENLKAAPLPRQATHVILPIPSLKDNECYCPDYPNGTQLALIRYPHAGRFEIPIVTVNNGNKEGRRVITNNNSGVAMGINSNVASRLSGADFDGDTVVCLPTNHGEVKNQKPLKGLEGFDPSEAYPLPPGGKVISEKNKQRQMGVVSNLITDMTLKGAPPDEMARAVRHSMVVIDAEKHELDWKKSAKDNNIDELQRKYQPKVPGTYKEGQKSYGGAGTIISRAKSEYRGIGERTPLQYYLTDSKGEMIRDANGKPVKRDKDSYARVGSYTVDPKTGKKLWDLSPDAQYNAGRKVKVYDEDGKPVILKNGKQAETKTYYDEDGEPIYNPEAKAWKSTKMAEADDARTLMSGTHGSGEKMELIYANYANGCKRLAENARKAYIAAGNNTKKDSNAAKKYSAEVDSLNAKYEQVMASRPVMRRAEAIASKNVRRIISDNPELRYDNEAQKKIRRQCINVARNVTGADKQYKQVQITEKEYEAILNGAVAPSRVAEILTRIDDKSLKEAATPKERKIMTPAQIGQAKAMYNNGYTIAQVAEMLGVSVSTIQNNIK